MAGLEPAALARQLGAVGICVWDGDFYAPRPVQILNAPGGSLLRVGFSMYNTRAEAARLVAMIKDLS
jgi:selenocysteine lyase/cysteine desulfurase